MKYLSGYTDPFISPVTGSVLLPENQVLLGDQYGHSKYSPTVLLQNLPNLLPGNIWLGIPQDAETSRPTPFDLTPLYNSTSSYPSLTKLGITTGTLPYVEFHQAQVNVDYAFGGEPFVVLGQSGEIPLTKAQNLGKLIINPLLTPNILKISSDSANPGWAQFELALPGIDFLTIAQLEEAEIAIFADVATSMVGAITAEIITPDPHDPQSKKIKTTFQNNAVFPGNASISIPQGSTAQRPATSLNSGMIRYNTDTNYYEGDYALPNNEYGWNVFYAAGKPTYITDTFGTGDNLYIGTESGTFLDGGGAARNIAIGLNTLSSPRDEGANPIENVAVGYGALKNCGNVLGVGSAARYNVAVGFSSQEFSSGDYNISIGHQSLQYGGFVKNSVAIGKNSLSRSGRGQGILSMLSPGGNHVAIGQSTLENMYKGDNNVAIGAFALQYPTNIDASGIPLSGYIDGSVAIGYCALQGTSLERFQTVTDGSVAIGAYAGATYSPFAAKPLGSPNIFIGYSAGRLARSGSSNIAIGYRALFYLNFDSSNPLTAESRHIAIGNGASINFSTSHAWLTQHPNLALGTDALGKNSTGRGNVAIGDSSLLAIEGNLLSSGGDFNTAVGYKSGTSGSKASELTNATAIGAFATARRSNTVVLGGQDDSNNVVFPDVAIGHQDPEYSLHIKETGNQKTAVLAIKETQSSFPSNWIDEHLFFYAFHGNGYFRSSNFGERKIGVNSVGTVDQIDVKDDPVDSTQKKISLVENPTIPGKKYVIIPSGASFQRPTVLIEGMVRYNNTAS